MQQPLNNLQGNVLSHQDELEMDNRGSKGSSIFSNFIPFQESAEIGDTSLCE